jgi:membrane protease YdiL (CAAX protease family)
MSTVTTPARASLREPLIAFALTTLLAAGFGALGAVVPLVRQNLSLLIAIVFFLAPLAVAKRAGREPEFDYREVGLRLDPIGLNLRVLGVMVLLAFPAFVVGFFVFYDQTCAHAGAPLARGFAPLCGRWLGYSRGHLQLPDKFALLAASYLVVTAIPEEVFFRGYLMERLERVWPPTRSVLGAKVGWALIVSSALFAVSHVAVIPNPQRLAVFFPALLFGWMRARTGSIAAAAAFHALCNVLSDVMHTSYFAH